MVTGHRDGGIEPQRHSGHREDVFSLAGRRRLGKSASAFGGSPRQLESPVWPIAIDS
jgi:hypothetical protein